MNRLFLINQHPSRQLLVSGLVIIACWIFFQLISIVTGIFIFGIPIMDLATIIEDFSNPAAIAFLKYVQAVTSFGMFVIASIIISAGIEINWMNFLTLNKRPDIYPLLLAGTFVIIILPFINLLGYLNNELPFPEALSGLEKFFRSKEEQMQQIMESFLNVKGMGGLLINLLVIAVIPALGEELIFRGIVQNRFTLWFKNHHLGILVTSIIFSALHIQFLSFFPRFFLGLILGYMFFWSRSIWITIIAHFINNALAVIFYHLYYSGKADKTIELIGSPQHGLLYFLFAVMLGGAVLFGIFRYYKKQRAILS